jgi:hypothetical protein
MISETDRETVMADKNLRVRRFTIGDAMILIAATAIGFAGSASFYRELAPGMDSFDGSWANTRQRSTELAVLMIPCLIAWTVTLIIIRLRQPRSSWRRLSREPGMTAGLAALLPLSFTAVVIPVLIFHASRTGRLPVGFWSKFPGNLMELFFVPAPVIGLCVLVAWVMLVLQGQWRSRREWIDQAGRLVGSLWIVTMIIMVSFWWNRLF